MTYLVKMRVSTLEREFDQLPTGYWVFITFEQKISSTSQKICELEGDFLKIAGRYVC